MSATLAAPLLIGLIATALLFDFLNGLHDAANSIATVVSTRVLRPSLAVSLGFVLQFHRLPRLRAQRRDDRRQGHRRSRRRDGGVIFAALCGAIVWDILTWLLGIPSSSSHALIGGLVGAAAARAGLSRRRLVGLPQDGGGDRCFAAARLRARAAVGRRCFLDVSALDSARRRHAFPHASARFGRALFARSRRQRRAKDHGHYFGAALLAKVTCRGVSTFRCGWCSPARRR